MRGVLRRGLREVRAHAGPAAGIALLTALLVTVVAGSAAARALIARTYDAWAEDLALPDVEVSFAPLSRTAALAAASHADVLDAEPSLVVAGVLDLGSGAHVPAAVRVLPEGNEPRIARLSLLEGRWPAPGEPAALADRSLRAFHEVRLGTDLSLRIGDVRVQVPVVGVVLGGDWLLHATEPGPAVPVRGTLAALSVSAATVPESLRDDRVTTLRVLLRPGADARTVAAAIAGRLPSPPLRVVTAAERPERAVLAMVLGAFDAYGPLLALVLVVVAGVLLLLTTARVVARRRATVGTLAALGHRRSSIAGSFVVFACAAAAAGVPFGVLGHGAFAHSMARSYCETVGLPPVRSVPVSAAPWVAAAACVATAALASFLTALALLRTPPALLLRYRAAPETAWGPVRRVAARLGAPSFLPRSVGLGLSALVRRPGATGAAAAGLGAALALVVALHWVRESHRVGIPAAAVRMTLDATVRFDAPLSSAAMEGLASRLRGSAEPWAGGAALLTGPRGGSPRSRFLVGADEGAWSRGLEIAEGRPPEAPSGEAAIDRRTAEEQGIGVGDRVRLTPVGGGEPRVDVLVVGVLEGPSLGWVLVRQEDARRIFRTGGDHHGVHVRTALPPAALAEVAWSHPRTASFVSRDALRLASEEGFRGGDRAFLLATLLAAALAVVFLGVLSALDAAALAPETALLRAIGWSRAAVAVRALTQAVVQATVAVALAAALAPLLASWLLGRMGAANHYRLDLERPFGVEIAVLGGSLLAAPLGAVPGVLFALRLSPARALRFLTPE